LGWSDLGRGSEYLSRRLRYSFLGCNFLGYSFLGCSFLGCSFLGCSFLGCSFLGCSFLGCSFLGCSFLGCSFLGCSFLGCSFLGCSFLGCSFLGCSFLGCSFLDWRLFRCRCGRRGIPGRRLEQSDFRLRRSLLRWNGLFGGRFRRSSLWGLHRQGSPGIVCLDLMGKRLGNRRLRLGLIIGSPGLVAPQQISRIPGLPRAGRRLLGRRLRRGFSLLGLGRRFPLGLLLDQYVGPRLNQIQRHLASRAHNRRALLKQLRSYLIPHTALWTYRFHN
jgi:hypothetical protein